MIKVLESVCVSLDLDPSTIEGVEMNGVKISFMGSFYCKLDNLFPINSKDNKAGEQSNVFGLKV